MKHGKAYDEFEDGKRFTIFKNNLDRVTRHNLEADLGHHFYKMGINKLSDYVSSDQYPF